ncbi:hypothetical protein SAMN05421846_108127 [Chryseobacterium taeanense]|uniref:Uncharacterized protein n=2 Tax=Chryseobacterium taeanense TaxID=311334 RepID=A0A1G8KZ78_9FLAO|nr:hypothetical protein SAMN05421846_108127 [Chryseobacterium taeanense]
MAVSAAISIFKPFNIYKMSIIKPLEIPKIKALGFNVRNAANSYRFFLEKKAKYHSVAGNFPNVDIDKISYQEYSEAINLKYQ